MIGIANTTVTILNGSGEPTYSDDGDPIENGSVSASGIPAGISERKMRVATETGREARLIRWYTARLPKNTAVTQNDRIRDEKTGAIYLVDSLGTTTDDFGLSQDLRLDLKKVN